MISGFASSDFGSLGIEYESTIIDAVSSRPLPLASQISSLVNSPELRGEVQPDFFEPTLEFITGICTSLDQARSDLTGSFRAAQALLDTEGACLLGMGLSPTAPASEFGQVDTPRYSGIRAELQWPGDRITTNGIHVHVGMASKEQALRTSKTLRTFLPLLLALSASSPFRHGSATGLASTRMALWSAIPRSGPMPLFSDLNDYDSFVESMLASDAITSLGDLRWDCRLNAGLGTLEIRILETVPDLDDALALCALAWCLSVGAERVEKFRIPSGLSDENRWRAIRYGTKSEFIIDSTGTTEPIGALVERLVELLSETADSLGCKTELDRCVDLGWGRGMHQGLATKGESMTVLERAQSAEIEMRVRW